MMLQGKVVVLNGAGGLLGGALAAAFAREGVAGLALGDLDPRAVVRPSDGHSDVVVREVDVTSQSSVTALVTEAVERFGRVDVVVNNAGVLARNGRIHNLHDEDWRRALDVNIMGAVHGIHAGVNAMRATGGGSIVNTASVAGLTAWSHSAPYSVTKAAVIHLTKVAALEYAKDQIRVNCVCPGVFPSAIHSDLGQDVMSALAAKHPLGLGTPEQLVEAFVYLASDGSTWTTGSAMVVDGGYSLP